jgi:UDP-N-acetyl-D-galactosamine dehydrogenase
MGKYIAEQTVKQMLAAGLSVKDADAIVLGLTFKEDCADLRNSKVIDVIRELQTYGVRVHVTDPIADPAAALHEYGIALRRWDDLPAARVIVATVAHGEFRGLTPAALANKIGPGGVLIDVKCVFDAPALVAAGLKVWRL